MSLHPIGCKTPALPGKEEYLGVVWLPRRVSKMNRPGLWVIVVGRDGEEFSVWCPENCLGPSDMKPEYHLAPTRGFTSFTVLDESDKAIGWVPKEAKRL